MRLHKDAKIELLKRVPLFRECSRRELAEIAILADELDFEEGRVLTREGERGREFIVVVEGTAEVRRGDQKINVLGAGEFFGEMSLVTGEPRTATVIATSPMRALITSEHAFRQLMKDVPGIKEKVERAVTERTAE